MEIKELGLTQRLLHWTDCIWNYAIIEVSIVLEPFIIRLR